MPKTQRVSPGVVIDNGEAVYTAGDEIELADKHAEQLAARGSVTAPPGEFVLRASVFEQPMNSRAVASAAEEGRVIPTVYKERRRGAVLTFDEDAEGEMIDRLLGCGAIEPVAAREARAVHDAKVADLDAERAKLEAGERERAEQANARRSADTARVASGEA